MSKPTYFAEIKWDDGRWVRVDFPRYSTRAYCDGRVDALDSQYPSQPMRIVKMIDGTKTVVRETRGHGRVDIGGRRRIDIVKSAVRRFEEEQKHYYECIEAAIDVGQTVSWFILGTRASGVVTRVARGEVWVLISGDVYPILATRIISIGKDEF